MIQASKAWLQNALPGKFQPFTARWRDDNSAPAQQFIPWILNGEHLGFWDTQHTTGVGYNLRAIKLAAATVRERLSPEHWSLIEQTEKAFFQPASLDAPVASSIWAQQLLARTSQLMAALTGAQTDRMTRDDGWRLLSIGRHIERLDFLAHALHSAIETQCVQSQAGFDAVLALFDSTISFHDNSKIQTNLGYYLTGKLFHQRSAALSEHGYNE